MSILFKTRLVQRLKWKDLRCSLSSGGVNVFAVSFNEVWMLCFCLLLAMPMTELDKNLKKRYNCCMSCQNSISFVRMSERERHLLFSLQGQVQRQCYLLKFPRNAYRSKAATCGVFSVITDASWINLTCCTLTFACLHKHVHLCRTDESS